MFRTLLILGILAICAFVAGWFTIDRNEKETTIRFNRDEIRADTSKMIAKGKELLQNQRDSGSTQQLDSSGTNDAFSSPDNQQATRPVPPWELPSSNASQY